jgi:predicted metal-dependent hydrolase
MASCLPPADPRRAKRMDSREKDGLFRQGLEAFNSSRFFQAHEHWEEVWLETPAPEKTFLQGLIQIAAGFHHYSRNNRQGARSLLLAGLSKLEHCPAVYRGLEIGSLRQSVRRWLESLETGNNPEQDQIPRISSLAESHESP